MIGIVTAAFAEADGMNRFMNVWIPYEKWVKWAWKFILLLVFVGFLLLLPTLFLELPGF